MTSTKGRFEEFQEEDVWTVSKSVEQKMSNFKTSRSSSFTSRPFPSAARMIPTSNINIDVQESSISHHSAPVKVPDWSKIYGSPKATAPSSMVDSWVEDGGDGAYEDEDEDGGDGDGMVPPHVLVDRRLARNQVSFSMCEGLGRTLKGRDLSKVRNDVLTKTGFIE